MKKLLNISLFIAAILFCASCSDDIDNYSSPNGGIKGTVYDKGTDEPIPLAVQGGSGSQVSLFEMETGATEAITFRAKHDGTFEHTKVFNGKYRIVLEGPFAGVCEDYITVKGETEVKLYAIPMARIQATATVSADNKVTISYQVDKTDTSLNLTDVSVIWNYAPGVDINSTNYASIASKGTVVNGTHVFDLMNDTQFIENHYKIVSNNNKIYIRMSATVNQLVNYSQVVEVVVNDIR